MAHRCVCEGSITKRTFKGIAGARPPNSLPIPWQGQWGSHTEAFSGRRGGRGGADGASSELHFRKIKSQKASTCSPWEISRGAHSSHTVSLMLRRHRPKPLSSQRKETHPSGESDWKAGAGRPACLGPGILAPALCLNHIHMAGRARKLCEPSPTLLPFVRPRILVA